MAVRPKTSGPNLFAAAGLDKDAPRPLADKLRPQKLEDVVGQDHLLGPDGALTRMLETRSRVCWRMRPTCISSRFPRSSPALRT